MELCGITRVWLRNSRKQATIRFMMNWNERYMKSCIWLAANQLTNPDLIFLHAPSVYDFRKESILYGPVSDLVPSTPVFEMYPIGFTTMAEYLERNGFQTRIINLAVRMLEDSRFDAEETIRKLDSAGFRH